MSNQQPNETRTPGKGGQKAGPDAQRKHDTHTNSSSAGTDDSDDMRSQHSSTRNLETEPDRARHADRNDERSRAGK
jgi:hypothetical protein